METQQQETNTQADGFTEVVSKRTQRMNRQQSERQTSERSGRNGDSNTGRQNNRRDQPRQNRPNRNRPSNKPITLTMGGSAQVSKFGVNLPLPLSNVPRINSEQRKRDEIIWFGDVLHRCYSGMTQVLDDNLAHSQYAGHKRMNVASYIGFQVKHSDVESGIGSDLIDTNGRQVTLPFIHFVSILQGLEDTENPDALKRYATRKYKELRGRRFTKDGEEVFPDDTDKEIFYSFDSMLDVLSSELNHDLAEDDPRYTVRCYRPTRHYKNRDGERVEGLANLWVVEVEWAEDPKHTSIVEEYQRKNPAW